MDNAPWANEKNLLVHNSVVEEEYPMKVDLDWSDFHRVLRLRTTVGDHLLVTFTYEKLQNFHYYCGCLRHLTKYCENQLAVGFVDPGSNTSYGHWIRVPPPYNSRNRLHASYSTGVAIENQRSSFLGGSSRSLITNTGKDVREMQYLHRSQMHRRLNRLIIVTLGDTSDATPTIIPTDPNGDSHQTLVTPPHPQPASFT
ncbi:hypothetical protein Salat_2143100 [Sesamum alatum]|uniref:Zinc knuckle CX2CX4HX4C domain-containing protein n=1 Tax=Sesamum alatum TaxID=300844 RepID=A0AAE2CH75_9LAMI|nr:hypothetical protein Salat_2143100 [Sesamum alatum]